MKVKPRIPRFAKCLWFGRFWFIICQLTSNDNSMILGEDNAVHIVVGKVVRFLSNGPDGITYITRPTIRSLHGLLSWKEP